MKARTNWNQEEKGGGDEYTNKDEGESIHAHTRDEQSKRAVSMENMDEGRKHALTGDEEMSSRGGTWKNNEFPCWEIQSSTLSHGVGVSTDFNKQPAIEFQVRFNIIMMSTVVSTASSPEPQHPLIARASTSLSSRHMATLCSR